MSGIEAEQRGVEAAPMALDPSLRPGVRYEDVVGTGVVIGVSQAIDDTRRNTECAPERSQQHGVLGAVAFGVFGDFQRRGIADIEVFRADIAAHELLQTLHLLTWRGCIARAFARELADFWRVTLQPIVRPRIRSG